MFSSYSVVKKEEMERLIEKDISTLFCYTFIKFTLKMTGIPSWNGKWTGEDKNYTKIYKFQDLRVYDKFMKGRDFCEFKYLWDDGWEATILVEAIDLYTAPRDPICSYFRNRRTRGDRLLTQEEQVNLLYHELCISDGFVYDWMVDKIINEGMIQTESERRQIQNKIDLKVKIKNGNFEILSEEEKKTQDEILNVMKDMYNCLYLKEIYSATDYKLKIENKIDPEPDKIDLVRMAKSMGNIFRENGMSASDDGISEIIYRINYLFQPLPISFSIRDVNIINGPPLNRCSVDDEILRSRLYPYETTIDFNNVITTYEAKYLDIIQELIHRLSFEHYITDIISEITNYNTSFTLSFKLRLTRRR